MEISARPVPAAAGPSTELRVKTVGDLDRDVQVLREHADAWARLGIAGKMRHLRTMRTHTIEVAQQWADLGADAKGIAGFQLAVVPELGRAAPVLTAGAALPATVR